jgi:periplasmic divalent cation tolerance protein
VSGSADGAAFVYVTIGDRDSALRLGRELVEARLAACANVIDGMRSLYWWQGAIEEADEAVLILKTRRELVEALTEKVRALHDYDCPCVVALPVVGGNLDFLDWIAAETAADA